MRVILKNNKVTCIESCAWWRALHRYHDTVVVGVTRALSQGVEVPKFDYKTDVIVKRCE